MGYTAEIKESNLIVHFYGELDHHISEKSRASIDQKYMGNNLKNIVFDLAQLTLMDSSGIGLIMGRYKLVQANNGKIALISTNVYVDRIIKMSGLLKIIDVYTDLEDALSNLEG